MTRGPGPIAGSVATIALIAPDSDDATSRESIHLDLGQATVSIMLAATDLSIGAGHSACVDQDLVRDILGFPDGHLCALLIAMGYPADQPMKPNSHPNRRPYAEVVHTERWERPQLE